LVTGGDSLESTIAIDNRNHGLSTARNHSDEVQQALLSVCGLAGSHDVADDVAHLSRDSFAGRLSPWRQPPHAATRRPARSTGGACPSATTSPPMSAISTRATSWRWSGRTGAETSGGSAGASSRTWL